MKKLFYLLSLSLLFQACLEQTTSSSTSSTGGSINTGGTTSGGATGSGNQNGGGSTGGGQQPGSGSSCFGTESDGQVAQNGTLLSPLLHYDMLLAGHQTWVPGDYSSNLAQQTMPDLSEASIFFKTDNKMRVRFKIHSQPFPTGGEEYCYGRATGQAADAFPYTKLRFRVRLRDIICDSPDPTNTNNCLSELRLGSAYATKYVEPLEVGQCSSILDFGHLRNNTQYGTVLEISDVKADSACLAGSSYYCPAEKIVRRASCWHMTMQLSTDYTVNFK